MRLHLIADWQMGNWALIPTLIAGSVSGISKEPAATWIFIQLLRGRLGVSINRMRDKAHRSHKRRKPASPPAPTKAGK